MEIFLIRHGQSLGNTKLDEDMPDSPLTEKGKAQSRLVAHYLKDKGITEIYSSPLLRAMESAQPLARLLGLPIQIIKSLYEVREGKRYEGPTQQTLLKLFPEAIFEKKFEKEGWICPGGDQPETVRVRAQQIIHQLYSFKMRKIAVFCHGNFNEYLIREVLGISYSEHIRFTQENTGINHFIIKENAIEVLKINDTFHLQLHEMNYSEF